LATNVAGVKNEFHTFQRIMHGRSHQPVSVRYESYQPRAGVCHDRFYILEVSCRGYD
jgi:hypothetical protein